MAKAGDPFKNIGEDLLRGTIKETPRDEKVVAQQDNTTEEHNRFGNQGQKGHRLKRINMGFTDENHAYIKAEADRQGIWMSELVNNIITAHRKENNS